MSEAEDRIAQLVKMTETLPSGNSDKTLLLRNIRAVVRAPLATIPPPATDGPPIPGNWQMRLNERFTKIDSSIWDTTYNGKWNNIQGPDGFAPPLTPGDGNAYLGMVAGKGSCLVTKGKLFKVGDYVEAEVLFPSDQDGKFLNWPAFWTTDPLAWPSCGEHDIAEVLGGNLTYNYHSDSGAHNKGPIPGKLVGSHTFGLLRGKKNAILFVDRKQVSTYDTDDNGAPHKIIFNMGTDTKQPISSNKMIVSRCKLWSPVSN